MPTKKNQERTIAQNLSEAAHSAVLEQRRLRLSYYQRALAYTHGRTPRARLRRGAKRAAADLASVRRSS